MDLANLIRQGEGQTTEFKKSLASQREGLQALCAMVNAESARGTVLFGIAPDGTVCGVEPGNLDKAQRSLSQAIRDKFDPSLPCEIRVEQWEGKELVVLTAERLRSVPYHEYDGRAWIREGSGNRQMMLSEKDQLRRNRDRAHHPGPWKCDLCGAWVGQLISFTMTENGMQKNYNCSCGGEFWPCT